MALMASSLLKSVMADFSIRRVCVAAEPSAKHIVSTMLDVITNTSMRTAP